MTAQPQIASMPNAHSHAFQRAMRGVAERPSPEAPAQDDFWSWRTAMFDIAAGLDPERIGDVARRAFSEMLAAGYGAVGEFHYVHHKPDGTPYADPNAMATAVAAAAVAAGLPIVVLPAAYARGGWDRGDVALSDGQRRFADPDVETFLERVDALRAWAEHVDGVTVGIAAHSTRAVNREWLESIAAYSERFGLVRHIHAHEQRQEIDQCLQEHGCSPIRLLRDTGFLGARTTVVHAVHVAEDDVRDLAETDTIVVSCPTTEGNLGDGHFPALRLADAGVRIAIGSDSQVRIDPFEEVRELETGARRERQTRSALLHRAPDGDLWQQVADTGVASLGLNDAKLPRIELDRSHTDLLGVSDEDLARAVATCASAGVVRRLL